MKTCFKFAVGSVACCAILMQFGCQPRAYNSTNVNSLQGNGVVDPDETGLRSSGDKTLNLRVYFKVPAQPLPSICVYEQIPGAVGTGEHPELGQYKTLTNNYVNLNEFNAYLDAQVELKYKVAVDRINTNKNKCETSTNKGACKLWGMMVGSAEIDADTEKADYAKKLGTMSVRFAKEGIMNEQDAYSTSWARIPLASAEMIQQAAVALGNKQSDGCPSFADIPYTQPSECELGVCGKN